MDIIVIEFKIHTGIVAAIGKSGDVRVYSSSAVKGNEVVGVYIRSSTNTLTQDPPDVRRKCSIGNRDIEDLVFSGIH